MKLLSWNVNGIRAAQKKGFMKWLQGQKADVVCVQETKATMEQVEEEMVSPPGYSSYWFSAEKKGYSGVATYSKKEPLSVTYGLGVPIFDCEGRVITTEHKKIFVVNAYFPNSQEKGARIKYKVAFCEEILKFCNKLKKKGKGIVLCGDYNIAHQEIDLKNPKQNLDNAGFLPEERQWMTKFLSAGYVDVFRRVVKGGEHYTYWSYRTAARERNAGWRIDYHCVNEKLLEKVVKVGHQPRVMGSDHCPVLLELQP